MDYDHIETEEEEIINDRIDEWHCLATPEPLHEYLGLTHQEYSRWVESPETLSEIIGKVITKRDREESEGS